jgi:ATP-binding cassette subfamily B protein
LGHFVVLFKLGGKLTIADPASGLAKWTPEEFRRRWSGRLILLVPTQESSEVEQPKSPAWRFFGLLTAHKAALAEALFCAFLVTLLGLGTSFFVQQMVDSILVHELRSLLNLVAVGMILLLTFRVAFGALRHTSWRI